MKSWHLVAAIVAALGLALAATLCYCGTTTSRRRLTAPQIHRPQLRAAHRRTRPRHAQWPPDPDNLVVLLRKTLRDDPYRGQLSGDERWHGTASAASARPPMDPVSVAGGHPAVRKVPGVRRAGPGAVSAPHRGPRQWPGVKSPDPAVVLIGARADSRSGVWRPAWRRRRRCRCTGPRTCRTRLRM